MPKLPEDPQDATTFDVLPEAARKEALTVQFDSPIFHREPVLPFFTLRPEQRVGDRFRVLGLLGRGSMGEVYRAEDLHLKESVALKVLRADTEGDPRAVDRFLREIRMARLISHPNVCRVLDTGVDRNRGPDDFPKELYYFTMELLEGMTLGQRLHRGGRLSPVEAAPLLRQLVDGLHAAHAVGVVHRDLKSENVLIVPSGGSAPRVVVTDFGLARNMRGNGWTSITRGFLGTPAYMAPEQVEGLQITPAADIYALGVVMFEMLTGKLPFHGQTPLETANLRLTQAPPSPRLHVPELDPRWEELILRCLARDPAQRFASALDVQDAMPHPDGVPSRSEPLVPWSETMPGAWDMETLVLKEPSQPGAELKTLPWPEGAREANLPGPRESIRSLFQSSDSPSVT